MRSDDNFVKAKFDVLQRGKKKGKGKGGKIGKG